MSFHFHSVDVIANTVVGIVTSSGDPSGKYAVSTDSGATWSPPKAVFDSYGVPVRLFAVRAVNGKFKLLGDNCYLESSDGRNWELKVAFCDGAYIGKLDDYMYAYGVYVATSGMHTLFSGDDSTWVNKTPFNIAWSQLQVSAVAARFVLYADDGLVTPSYNLYYASRMDGEWIRSASITAPITRFRTLNGKLIGCSRDGKLHFTSNGITWTSSAVADNKTILIDVKLEGSSLVAIDINGSKYQHV